MISSVISPANHLSDDEIDEILILGSAPSDLPDEWCEHLAACAACRGKVEAFDSSMDLFNQASLAWSEAKSNTLTRDITAHKPAFRPHFSLRWGLAVASVVAVLVTVPAVLRHREATTVAYNHAPVAAELARTADAAPPTSEEIAQDNAFLRAVDEEIDAPESPLDSYSSSAAMRAHRSPQTSGPVVRQVARQVVN